MRISSLLQKLEFVGQAEGDRRTYYIFEGSSGYVVASPNGKLALNVTVVDREVPKVIGRRFEGQQVTARILRTTSRRPDLFGANFAALNALYVMVALGRARKLKKRQGRAMVFKIK
jgi:hypothetical protein